MKLVNLLVDEAAARGGSVEGAAAGMDAIKCPRRLNLDLPLLSTRLRSGALEHGFINVVKSQDVPCNRIPFSWELTPGKPRENNMLRADDMDITPRLRPPPSRWKVKQQEGSLTRHDELEGSPCRNGASDEGADCSKPVDALLDAVDAMSLTEAIDIAQREENDHDHDHDRGHDDHRLALESSIDSSDNTDENKSTSLTPSFMIQRFLPDATAIAASSVAYLAKDVVADPKAGFPTTTDHCNSLKKPRKWSLARSSSKSRFRGCGLHIFYSWRSSHRLRSVKSPGKEVNPKLPLCCGGGKLRKHFLPQRPPLPS